MEAEIMKTHRDDDGKLAVSEKYITTGRCEDCDKGFANNDPRVQGSYYKPLDAILCWWHKDQHKAWLAQQSSSHPEEYTENFEPTLA